MGQLVENPDARATTVKSKHAAAKLHQQLATGLMSGNGDTAWRDEADEALRLLEREWGEDIAKFETGDKRRASGSRSTKSARGRAQPSGRAPTSSKRRRGAPRPSPSRGRRGGGPSPRVKRAFKQTGIPGATATTSELALRFAGITIGLSVAVLLLRNAGQARRGHSAIELLSGGLQSALRVVVEPVDPLNFPRKSAGGKAAIDKGLLGADSPLANAPVSVTGPYDRIPAHRPSSKPRHPIGGNR